MKRDNIIRMAQESGFNPGKDTDISLSELEQFYAAAYDAGAAAAREACARLCDEWPNGRDDVCLIAEAIRARGEK
jgi:hypothetical protein